MRSTLILSLLLIYFSNLITAQSFVIQYDYSKRVKKDSTRIVSQNTFLNIEENYSTFFSEAPYLADSIIASDKKLGNKINAARALFPVIFRCFQYSDISTTFMHSR